MDEDADTGGRINRHRKGAVILCSFLLLSPAALVAADRPNVLLILVDDLKPSFGAYGDSWVHSPNLDRLAARGIRFDLAYSNQAVCAPSRNHLMTGARSTSLGIYTLGEHFRKAVPDAVTMPQHFKQHGYHAAGIGKVFHIGHGNVDDELSWSVPFHPDKVIDYVLPESTGGTLTREEALFANKSAAGLPRGAAWEKANVDDSAYADGRIAAEGIRRLETYKKTGQPFFLAIGFVKPHLPFCAPAKYWNLYDPGKLRLAESTRPPDGAPGYAGKTLGELDQYDPVPATGPLPEELARTLIHGYYASLSYMDAQVGRVLDELDRLDLAGNTIIALWGDHGYHLGDHGSWTKHTNYEQANRIPLIIVAPGVTTPGTSTRALVETVDIYPTLAALAELPAPVGPQPIDGRSLVPVLKDPARAFRDHAYHCFPRGDRLGRAIRTARHRMVEWKRWGAPSTGAEYELYDYVDDPLETKNIARERPEVLAELAATLASHPEAVASAARAAERASGLLMHEGFDDARLLERGWYDGDTFAISRDRPLAGQGCLEYRWDAGKTNPASSSGVRHLFEPTDTVHLRFYIKLSEGWGWSGRPYHPHLITFMTTENEKFAGPAASHLTVYVEPWNGKLRLAAQDIQNKDKPHGLTQGPLQGGWNGKLYDSEEVLFQDGVWHCVEAMFRLNSLDTRGDKAKADGIIRGWFDGKLVIDRADVVLRSTDFPGMKFRQLLLMPYFGPGLLPHEQTLWIDELTVGTKRAMARNGGTRHR